MKPNRHNRRTPPPEQLTAYVGGELDARTQCEVDAWLAQHPQAAAELEAQRRLAQLWQASRPTPPPESAWVEMLEQIETALNSAPAPAPQSRPAAGRTSRSRRAGWLVRLTAAAAAVWLLGSLEPIEPPEPSRDARVEPFPVAAPEDVDIISMHANDSGMLVVGEPPVRDPLDLATAGDVTIHSVQPDVDGMLPKVWGQGEAAAVPMIVAPLVAVQTQPRPNR
jgi:hypothetical protein